METNTAYKTIKKQNVKILESDRIKNLYGYKIGQKNISIKNDDKIREDYQVISENIKKLKEVSDN